MLTRTPFLLRLEGLALLAVAVAAYAGTDGAWWTFAVLLFVPDVAMLGYLGGPRLGAATYNLAHTTVLPFGLALVAYAAGAEPLLSAALVWAAHVGLDRALGYGLKAPSGFRDTHLGRIGPSAGA